MQYIPAVHEYDLDGVACARHDVTCLLERRVLQTAAVPLHHLITCTVAPSDVQSRGKRGGTLFPQTFLGGRPFPQMRSGQGRTVIQ